MKVGLIGPVQSGKSTLFAAVAEAGGSHVDLSRPDQAHTAVVKVPDKRVEWLAEQYHPKKVIFAELNFVDLPGYDLANTMGRERMQQLLPQMRMCNMLVVVLGAFETINGLDSEMMRFLEGELRILRDEMLLADLAQVTERIDRLEKTRSKNAAHRDLLDRELRLMARLQKTLEAEQPLAPLLQDEAEEKMVRGFGFLTQKPLLVVLNGSEAELKGEVPSQLASVPCLVLSARLEEEIAQLPPAEQDEFQQAMGLHESARDRLIRACYDRLQLQSFLTVGEDECRAWTITAGTNAVDAAAEIHSDLSRGFIRAETVAYDDFRAAGNMKNARAVGKIRLEGREYIVQDGDIINFRFNI